MSKLNDLKVVKKKPTTVTIARLIKAVAVTGHKMRIAETEYALKSLRKTQPGITMDSLRLHNSHCDGYEEGWIKAMEHIKKELGL